MVDGTAEAPAAAAAVPLAEAVEEAWFDEYGPSEYPDFLYVPTGEARWIDGFEAFDADPARHVAFFREHGYLAIHNAFTSGEIGAALEGLLDLIDGKSPEFSATKGIQFEATARDLLPTLPREQKQDYVRKLNRYAEFDPRLKAMAVHPRLLAVVRAFIGEEPALFADQAMLKPPLIGREKPWHQDHAFFNVPLGTQIVGCWIALDEALPENGCMHVIPGGHRQPIVHFKRRDWQICDTDVDTAGVVAVPLPPGGVLFFDGLLPHGTPATRSPRRRRALQLHYIPASVGRIATEDRMAIFGSEGKDVTC
jgi:phytanoyl-CoA hydroxylase